MRPVILTSVTLAAVSLGGALWVGESDRPSRRSDRETSPPAGFFAPSPELPTSPPQGTARDLEHREFYFTRAVYSSGLRGWRRRGSWATDYPKADRQFIVVVRRVTNLDAFDRENAVSLADPEVRRYPFLYALEVGYMRMTDAEVRGLREYLDAGGFLIIDDFWGTREWANFQAEMARVLPGRPIVDLPMDHPIFSAFYNIEEVLQVPGRGGGVYGRPTWQRDGYDPVVRGIFDEDGRLVVVINFNTDLGDAWEWAEDPFYPLEYSTFAYEMGVNMIVYAMSH